MLSRRSLALLLALATPAAALADATLSGTFPDGTPYSLILSTAGEPAGSFVMLVPNSGTEPYSISIGGGYGYYTSGGGFSWTDWFAAGEPDGWLINSSTQQFYQQYSPVAGATGTWTIRFQEQSGSYSTAYGYFNWDGTNVTPYQNQSCPLKYTFVSTSLVPQTVSIAVGATTIASGTVQPYQSITLTGTATGSVGASIITNSSTTLVPYANYDPAMINAMGSEIDRTYYVGNDPSTLIPCIIVVQADNPTAADCSLTVSAGNLNIISADVPGNQTATQTVYQSYKASLPLPVGATISVATTNHSTLISGPTSAVVAANNYNFLYVLQIDSTTSSPPAQPLDNTTVTVTRDSNGDPTSDTINVTGTATTDSSSMNTNLSNQVANGQVAQAPTVNGQPITTAASQASTSGTSSTTTTTTSTGTNSTTSVLLSGDQAILQQIATNTAQQASEDAPPSGLQPFAGPSGSPLNPYSPALSAGLQGLNPLSGFTVPAATAPVLVLPLSLVSSQIADYRFDFSQGTPNTVATTGRAALLFVVACWFIFHHVRLISRTFGV